ncbi:transcriptional regulator [Streptomyces sp. XD-27]|uniref:helix-turn-helix transcriptional regulator n=1 Tax=Streptomyces sp. XD-27 TaxID=3062779 RepID=UPI0026F41F8E|nr:helix-turn-helix transcriptional regulator [Streptomyces sp. XD-27]WKX70437.1 helix-turn-helix transcriptional regulator [Streptomyces sp. XD-27]
MSSSEADLIIAALRPVAEGLAATLGRSCEVVVHDFRRPEGSVAVIAGDLTGRTVGGAMSQIGMDLLRQGDAAPDRLNYVTRTPSGRMLKSSTVVLRTSDGTAFGAFCVNLDITALRQVHELVGDLVGVGDLAAVAAGAAVPTTTFSNDVDDVVDAAVDGLQLAQGKQWADLDRAERIALFARLEATGVFAMRRAVPRVAARLGISRASAYAYLSDVRKQAQAEPAGRTSRKSHTSLGEGGSV